MKLQYFLSLIAFSIGCSGDKTEETGEEAFAPAEGNWSFGSTAYGNDTCNMESNATTSPAIIDALVFTLTNNSAAEITLTNETGTNFLCSLSDMTLTCETITETDVTTYNDDQGSPVLDSDGSPIDPDANTIATLVAVATFTDAETATYSATMTGECSGDDCEVVLASLGITESPCESDYSGTFELQE